MKIIVLTLKFVLKNKYIKGNRQAIYKKRAIYCIRNVKTKNLLVSSKLPVTHFLLKVQKTKLKCQTSTTFPLGSLLL